MIGTILRFNLKTEGNLFNNIHIINDIHILGQTNFRWLQRRSIGSISQTENISFITKLEKTTNSYESKHGCQET